MKNKITIFAVITMAAFVFAVSCKKENMNINKENNKIDNYSLMINKRINSFRNLMQSTYKTGGTMPLDSAVWNLEALISYDNAYPDSASEKFTIFKANFILPVNENNMVDEDDVQVVYQQMLDTINAQFARLNNPVKFLVFSDVQTDSVVNGTAYLSSNDGYGEGIFPGMYDPFTDDWIWGTLSSPQPPYAGNCDGSDFSSDGSNEIEYRLNNPNFAFQGSGTYTDYVTVDVDVFNCYYYNGNPRVFSTTNLTECMYISDLDYYLAEGHDIIYLYNDPSNDNGELTICDGEGARPTDKDFISIKIVDELIVPSSPFYFHRYEITYAKPFISPE